MADDAALADRARRYKKARENRRALNAKRDARDAAREERASRRARDRSASSSPRSQSGGGVFGGVFATVFGGRRRRDGRDGEREGLLEENRREGASARGDGGTDGDRRRRSRATDGVEEENVNSDESDSDSSDDGEALARARMESAREKGYVKLTREALASLSEMERGESKMASTRSRVPVPSTTDFVHGMIPKTWRTWAATASVSFACFTVGLAVGYPFAARGSIVCAEESTCDEWDTLREDELSVLQAALFIGAVLGSILAGWTCDRFGRGRTVVVATVPATIGWFTIFASAPVCAQAALAKVLVGVSVGLLTTAAPLLLTEAAAKVSRGAHAVLPNAAIVKGVLFMYLAPLAPVPLHWRTLAMVCVGFNALAVVVAAIFVVESPRWYLARAMHIEAVRALTTLRGAWSEMDTMNDTADIIARENSKTSPPGSLAAFRIWHLVTNESLMRGTVMVCTLVAVQQLGGLSLAVHDDSEIPDTGAVPSSSETRIAYVLTLMLGIMLCSRVVDLFGRRASMLVSLGGMFASNLAMVAVGFGFTIGAARDAINAAVICFAFFFGLGMATVPMLTCVETFPQHARASAMGLAAALYWTYVFVESFAYDLALEAFGARVTHGFFTVVCAIGAYYVRTSIPEASQISLEDAIALTTPRKDPTVARTRDVGNRAARDSRSAGKLKPSRTSKHRYAPIGGL